MKKKFICLFIFVCMILTARTVCAEQGALSTGNNSQVQKNQPVYKIIEEYVGQLVLQSVLSEVGDTVKKMMRQGNIQLMSQMVYLAINQSAAEIFRYPTTKQITQDAYRYCYDKATGDFDRGVSQIKIQANLQTDVKNEIAAIRKEQAFVEIIKRMLKKTLEYQSKIMMQYAVQRQTQQIMMQQQVMQKAVVEMYQHTIMDAQKQMVEKQAQNNQLKYEWMANQYQNDMMKKYEEALRQQQAIFSQQFK